MVADETCKPPSGFGSTFNQYLWQRMNTADTKVGTIAAADLAFLTLFVPNTPLGSFSTSSPPWDLYVVAILLFAFSALASLVAFLPKRQQGTDQELIFWRGVLAQPDGKKYLEELKKLLHNQQAVEDAYAGENYRVCKNFLVKNRVIRLSIVLFASGLPFALVSLALRGMNVH